jgi:carboxypeptidase C (cathepsin A)
MLDHLPAIGDPTRAGLRNYRGGHMFYIDANSRRAFSTDAKAFYDGEP